MTMSPLSTYTSLADAGQKLQGTDKEVIRGEILKCIVGVWLESRESEDRPEPTVIASTVA